MKCWIVLAVAFTVCQARGLFKDYSGSGSGDYHWDNDFYCHLDEPPYYTTIPQDKVCDGNNDCPGHESWREDGGIVYEDETIYACAKEDDFICHCEEKLIKQNQVCDGTKDCECDWTELGEDENYYECYPDLEDDQYLCNADTIISKDQECDGTVDCESDWNELGDDENYYTCPPGDDYFVCSPDHKIDASAKCDGNNDCPGQDEDPWICEWYKESGHYKNFTCWGWPEDGPTLSLEQLCDGVNDCKGNDEEIWNCDSREDSHSNDDEGINEVMRREIMKRYQDKMMERRGVDKRHPLRQK